MLPCSRIDTESHQVYLKSFESSPVGYVDSTLEGDPNQYTSWSVSDGEKSYLVQLKKNDLLILGISLVALDILRNKPARLQTFLSNTAAGEELLEHVGREIRPGYTCSRFFNDLNSRRVLNCTINRALVCGTKRTEKTMGMPGVYISGSDVFINLKGFECLGMGSSGKVKYSARITDPLGNWLVAKKKFHLRKSGIYNAFTCELKALEMFRGQVGIINMIAGGEYGDKRAIFLPLYDCNLWTWLTKAPFPLNTDEKLTVFSHWLLGLAKIAKKGSHRDLSLNNLLIKREGPEGVISDLGSFRVYGDEEPAVTTWNIRPPEYFKGVVTAKQDVWGLGLAMQAMLSKEPIPLWAMIKTQAVAWIPALLPDWSLKYPMKEGTPPFLVSLINDMLNIDPDKRLSAEKALERFLEGKVDYEGH